jgi:DNA-binding MarR family transcriptional regulator
MQVILQGSLRHFPAADLLTFVCRRTQSGTLDVDGGGRRARIFFAGDRIVWAESSMFKEAADSLFDALTWTDGTFTVLDSHALPEDVVPLDLDVAAALDEARKRAEAAAIYRDTTQFHVVDDPQLQQQVSLTGDELRLLFRISAGRTFRQLADDLGGNARELADRLQRLEQLGLVAVVREESAGEKTDPRIRTRSRARTIVGSLTPDASPDKVFPLLDEVCSIGRTPENTIAIPDGSVSSSHARITRTPSGFVLEDLQSRNGTFVNGEKVAEKRVLADGDLIRLGKIIMTFNLARESRTGDETQPEVRLE